MSDKRNKGRLKDGMPHVLPDHRSREAKRLRRTWDDMVREYGLRSSAAKRQAVLVARAWLDYEGLTAEVERLRAIHMRTRKSARGYTADLRRAMKRQQVASLEIRNGERLLRELGKHEQRPVQVDDLVDRREGV